MKIKKEQQRKKNKKALGVPTLEKTVKNVKAKIKKDKEIKIKKSEDTKIEKQPKSSEISDPKSSERSGPKKFDRGVVYLGHVPHGFYEEQMESYFKQFGKVTRVRVARSNENGKSRGYAYIEMENTEVAKIAAESMNNYLMCGRLLKASYIPPDKQNLAMFLGENWSEAKYPKLEKRRKEVEKNHEVISKSELKKSTKKSLKRLQGIKKKLKMRGIDFKLKPDNARSY